MCLVVLGLNIIKYGIWGFLVEIKYGIIIKVNFFLYIFF